LAAVVRVLIKNGLFEYQVTGARWLATKTHACLYDEQGLGKSAQAITACDLVHARRVLIICRAVAVENWKNEFKMWSETSPEVVVTSYESLHKAAGAGSRFDVVVVDEAHYLKEPTAKRTQSILGKAGILHRANYVWLLTGTPTPNHAGELWTTLFTFGRTRLSYDEFVDEFCTSRETAFGRQITGTNVGRVGELRKICSPHSLRRTKEQVLTELPQIFYQNIVVEPGPVEIGSCQSFVRFTLMPDGIKELTDILEHELGVVAGIVGGKVFTFEAMKALETASKSIMTLRRYSGLQKVKPCVDMVTEELRSKAYEKIVIFAVHRDTVETLTDSLKKEFGAVNIYGGSKPSRDCGPSGPLSKRPEM
jgi:SWI/SNF-related matrix-associated actin-dependent regulator 1 of chromatin subfamily A